MTTSEQINEIASAMAKAQAAMRPAVKDALNPHFNAKYSDLAAVWDACRLPLTTNGISVFQDVTTTEVGIAVMTRLAHTSGQWVEFGPLVVPLVKRDAHGVGSATSYGKRYALSAAVGIVSDDDDGNAAVQAAPAKRAAREPQPKAPDMDTTELPDPRARPVVTVAQRKRLYAIGASHDWTPEQIKALLQDRYKLASSADIPVAKYDEITDLVAKTPPPRLVGQEG